MEKQDISVTDPNNLLMKAEIEVPDKPLKDAPGVDEQRRIIHQVEVYHAELEYDTEAFHATTDEPDVVSTKPSAFIDLAPCGQFTLSSEGIIIDLNLMGAQMLGQERINMKNCPFEDFVSEKTRPLFKLFFRNMFTNLDRQACEVYLMGNGKRAMPVLLSGMSSQHGTQCTVKAVDISRHQNTEALLREKEELLKKAQEIANLGSWSLDLQTNRLSWSDETYRIFGFQPQEISPTYEDFLDIVHPQDRQAVNEAYTNSILEGKDSYQIEHRIVRRHSGQILHVMEKCEHLRDASGKIVRSVGMTHDITGRKAKEEKLRKLNQTLAALSKSSQARSHAIDEADYLKQVCRIVVEDTEFAMVWIGFAQEDQAKTIRPVASAGFKDDYLQTIKLSWDDSEWGNGPTGTAIKTGNISICNNILTDPAFEPWRDQALKRGYASSIVFPLKTGDKTFGSISIYSNKTDSFLEDEIKLLSELANDLAQGITTLRLRAAHQLAQEALTRSHSELELQVKQRTRELEVANDLLKKEINLVRQHEQSLKEAEEKYRTVADHTHNWEFWLDKNNRFIYCSPSCQRITGYPVSAFLEKPALLFEIVHPHDKKIFQHHKTSENSFPDRHFELEHRIVRADGTIRWISHECHPILDQSGQFKGTRGSNKDITERKEIEQLLKTSSRKYRLLSANISDGIFICTNGCFQYVNKAMKRIFGYADLKMEGLMLTQLALPEYHDQLNSILNINSSVNQLRTIEIECLTRELSTIHVEMLFNYVAKEKAFYGVVHDITEKKQLQQNILKTIILTEEKERAYYSKELHDGLGPLLSTIKLYLQWLDRPKTKKSRAEIIHQAESITEEALTTVKEISNKLSPHLLINYGLTSAIQCFVDNLSESSAIQIAFHSNVSRRLDPEIEAALYRALIECINNTIKHAGACNILITLNDAGSHLQLRYTDDGIGFNMQEALSLKKGLGLYNLQNRIETIGGKITMTSGQGKGVDYQIVVKL